MQSQRSDVSTLKIKIKIDEEKEHSLKHLGFTGYASTSTENKAKPINEVEVINKGQRVKKEGYGVLSQECVTATSIKVELKKHTLLFLLTEI